MHERLYVAIVLSGVVLVHPVAHPTVVPRTYTDDRCNQVVIVATQPETTVAHSTHRGDYAERPIMLGTWTFST